MSDEKENLDKSPVPRDSNLRRTQSYRHVLPYSDFLTGITGTGSSESNPARNTPRSVETPKADSGTSKKLTKPLKIVQRRRLRDFKPLAFPENLPRATRVDIPLTPLIITVDLSGPDPSVKAEVRNRYFSRPKMFRLWSGNVGRLVTVQFQIWVPYPFKHLIDSLTSLIIKEKELDMKKLVQMSNIVADVVSPGEIAIEVGAAGQGAESNVSDFACRLLEMLDRGDSPDNLRKIYPAFSLDVELQKELSVQPDISETAEASRKVCHFFNMIGRNLWKILKYPGGIQEARRADERFRRTQHFVFHYYGIVASQISDFEKTETKFEVLLEALRTTVDSIADLINLELPLDVTDLHQLKSAVIDYVWYDIAAQKSMLTNAKDEDKMFVVLARDLSYEMYRCAFPNPPKITVKYTTTDD